MVIPPRPWATHSNVVLLFLRRILEEDISLHSLECLQFPGIFQQKTFKEILKLLFRILKLQIRNCSIIKYSEKKKQQLTLIFIKGEKIFLFLCFSYGQLFLCIQVQKEFTAFQLYLVEHAGDSSAGLFLTMTTKPCDYIS